MLVTNALLNSDMGFQSWGRLVFELKELLHDAFVSASVNYIARECNRTKQDGCAWSY